VDDRHTDGRLQAYIAESIRFVFLDIFDGFFYFRPDKYLATCVPDISVKCVGVWSYIRLTCLRIILKICCTKFGENLSKSLNCLRTQMKTPLALDSGQSSTSHSGCFFVPGKEPTITRRLGAPQSQSKPFGEEKTLLRLIGIEPHTLQLTVYKL
jgi:hypothetical protein